MGSGIVCRLIHGTKAFRILLLLYHRLVLFVIFPILLKTFSTKITTLWCSISTCWHSTFWNACAHTMCILVLDILETLSLFHIMTIWIHTSLIWMTTRLIHNIRITCTSLRLCNIWKFPMFTSFIFAYSRWLFLRLRLWLGIWLICSFHYTGLICWWIRELIVWRCQVWETGFIVWKFTLCLHIARWVYTAIISVLRAWSFIVFFRLLCHRLEYLLLFFKHFLIEILILVIMIISSKKCNNIFLI